MKYKELFHFLFFEKKYLVQKKLRNYVQNSFRFNAANFTLFGHWSCVGPSKCGICTFKNKTIFQVTTYIKQLLNKIHYIA